MERVTYCEYKILIDAARLRGLDDFKSFWLAIKGVAAHCDVDVYKEPHELEFGMRRVGFYDTPDFDLYRNAFIYRKRTTIAAGFAASDETTLKFRHPELIKAQAVDIKRAGASVGSIKFKEELLCPRDGSVGYRSIFSHNHVDVRDTVSPVSVTFGELAAQHPAVATLPVAPEALLVLVNDKTIEESECDTGRLVFSHDCEAKSSIAIWRDRATGESLIGEFSFQTKFEDRDDVGRKAQHRTRRFFERIQEDLRPWLSLGTTKTAAIYGRGDMRE